MNRQLNKDVSFWRKVPKRIRRGGVSSLVVSFGVPALALASSYALDKDAIMPLVENMPLTKKVSYGASIVLGTLVTSVLSQEFLNEGAAERSTYINLEVRDDLARKPRLIRQASTLASAFIVTAAFFNNEYKETSVYKDKTLNSAYSIPNLK